MAKQQSVLIGGVWVPTGGAPGADGPPGADGAQGPQGPPGTAYLNSQWDFNQNTTVSPAQGTMRMDATTYPATTQLWVSEQDRDNLDRHLGLDLCVPGDQIIMQSAQGRAVWDVTSHADSGTYRTIGVTLVESSGSRPSAGSKTTLYFVTEGGGGSTILSGTATPTADTGAVGDYYLDTDDRVLYGPKVVPAYGAEASVHTSQTPEGNWTSGAQESGLQITCAEAGLVTGLRYYRSSHGSQTTSRVMKLWNVADGTLLGSVATAGEAGTGWFTATLATPIPVAAGQQVVVSYNGTGVAFPATLTATFPIVNGLLTATTGCMVSGSGYPATTNAADYFLDIIFSNIMTPAWPVALKSVPPGGTTGQVLKKTSGTDYDATWGTDTLLLTTPNILWQVPDILAWLTGHGVAIDNPNLSKPELLAIAADLLDVP